MILESFRDTYLKAYLVFAKKIFTESMLKVYLYLKKVKKWDFKTLYIKTKKD